MNRARLLGVVQSVAVAGVLVFFWQVVADYRLVSPVYVPGPDRIFDALREGFGGGDLGSTLLATIGHLAAGWLLASIIGIAIGAVIGSSPSVRPYINPILEFFRPLPASSMFPFAMALFGLSNQMVLSVIAFGALWPTLLATIHGFASVEARLLEVSRILGMSRFSVMMKVQIPNALPDILSGMRISMTVALVLSVVGEIMASVNGLGLWVLLAARSFHAADLFAGVVLLGGIGYLGAQVLTVVEDWALRWQHPR